MATNASVHVSVRMSYSLLPTKGASALVCWQPVSSSKVGASFLHLCTDGLMIFLTGIFLFLECGQVGRWVGTQKRHSGASPPKGSPDWCHDHCWNRHCARVGGETGAPHSPAWRSRLPGVPDSLSPGKARRWRVSEGSWSCGQGRHARASSRHLSGPAHCTRLCSFRSSPRQGWSGCLQVGDKQTVPSDSFILIRTTF